MKTLGYDQPLYILPFDHRGSFVTKMFGWHGGLTPAQTAEIAAAKRIIYDGFRTAIAGGVPKNKGASSQMNNLERPFYATRKPKALPLLVRPRRAGRMNLILNTATTLPTTSKPFSRLFARCSCVAIPKATQY